jgi:Fe-S oxidoreductase
MALEDLRNDMEMCCRCSDCKFIPLERVTGLAGANICPSIARYNFHAYSGGGRLAMGIAMLENRLEYTDKLLDIVYNCQMCGGCDISCKYAMDMEVLKPINEIRIRCVADGRTRPALDGLINSLRRQDTMVPAKSRRGEWAAGLGLKDFARDKAPVIYHAGCRTCYDRDTWKVAQANASLLRKAGVDFAVGGASEPCCGGRAYQMGYKDDFLRQAEKNMETFRKSGARTLVTGCADCYYAFKVLYDKFGLAGDLEVLHTTEYFARLLDEGRLKPSRQVDLRVTYHDPCHLGRLGEPYIHWDGKQAPGQIRVFDPPKEFRRGTHGVYGPPRQALGSIPALKLVEMGRTREYAWCCGAGGGVRETNPEFALWTAGQRLAEAEETGAGAIVTACPGCEQTFRDAIRGSGSRLKVYDVAELLDKSVREGGR